MRNPEKIYELFCLRFHKGLSCAEIGRQKGLTRHTISKEIAIYLDKFNNKEITFPSKCISCRRMFIVPKMKEKRKRIVIKKYSPEEIEIINKANSISTLFKIAKRFNRTLDGVRMKAIRLKLKKKI